MKAIIRKIGVKHIQATNGQKFDKVRIECDVIMEDGRVKSRGSEMSMDYAKKYFNFCNISSKDAVGMEVDVVLQKRAFTGQDGETHTFEEIRYLNFLDKDGKPIIMPKENVDTGLPF